MNFREQIIERLRVHLGGADVPAESLQAFASDLDHLLGRALEGRAFGAGARQILQRFASEWAGQNARRTIEQSGDGATDVVYEMIERRARDRAVRALRQAILDALEGKERPLDDLDFFQEE
ncbi:MAG: hypothetical protein A3J27_05985 [Candidatus Tectomicrobia bacterium RIFCSPLOWO2_12_FULL_69_37]|nr:MAG: hypothetical protein A3I72_15025 [Candidatus Tectomicrobia bacterium RIFCSPLOWO2_02_FULL_70_19]OGL67495.1 MAG: hypothetical protein A3J27_05985 [Candidatus Tectomicrobia bacterium RIFCSPLOWO2_12_FULL_69_37]